MVKYHRILGILVLSVVITPLAYTQQGLLQNSQMDDVFRRAQIAGETDTIDHSFLLTPYQYRFNDRLRNAKWNTFQLHSVVGYTLQNNSALPYSYNDENLYPATGFQQRFTAGVRLESRDFIINLQPQWVTAANTVRNDLLPPASSDLNNYWGKFFAMLGNRIDMPSRFGDKPLSKVYPGQSSIRYKTALFSAGVSTENIWWGPARVNSLVLSNNAPGFLHATVNTVAPLKTPIGNFEAQFIYGKLDSSGFTPPEFSRIAQIGCPQCYEPPPNQTRNITGYAFSFSPKGLENFFLGMAYASYRYADTNLRSSGLGSIFFRYIMPKDNAELYAEYGRSDKHMSPFDLFRDSVPFGYTVGLRKMVPLRDKKSYISIAAELTHLGLSKAKLIFDRNNIWGGPNPNSYSWYTSPTIRHGYTNSGQVMGAGIGPGSNSQTLIISWVKEQNQLGLQLQRVMRNTDFYYYYYFNGLIGLGNTAAFWTDISASLFAQWQYKNFLFAGSVDHLSSINYKWLKLDGGFEGPSSLSDKKNFQIRLSVLYSLDWMALKKN